MTGLDDKEGPMKTSSPHLLAPLALSLGLIAIVGCGDSAETVSPANSTASRPLGFTVDGESDGTATALHFQDDSGARWTLQQARFVVRHIELDLPGGVTCDDVRGALAGGVRCSSSADDNGADDNKGADDKETDDNGADDIGPDDKGIDDDGTDDKGTDDNGADDSSSGGTLRIDGPIVVDLLAGTTSPSLDGVRVLDVGYRRIDIRIDDADTSVSATDPLRDHSWYFVATTDDDEVQRLEARLRFNEDIRLEAAGGLRTDANSPLLVSFDASQWFRAIPVVQCVADGRVEARDGVLTIDDDGAGRDCSDFENTLKDNLKRSADLR